MQASTEIPDHVTLEHVNVSHSAKRVDGDDNGVVGMSPKYFKIILTTGLFLLTIAVSLIPLKFLALARRGPLRRRRRFRKVLSLLSCFAGGVFLGACFLDLFPEVKEAMGGAIEELGLETEFPIPEFVMVYGLFIVLTTEQLVVQYQERGQGPALAGHGHSHGGTSRGTSEGYQNASTQSGASDDEEADEDEDDDGLGAQPSASGGNDQDSEKAPLVSNSAATARVPSPRAGYGSISGRSVAQESGSLDYSHAHARHHERNGSVAGHHHHRHHHNEQLSDRHSSLRALLLLLALSLHSLFEGLALGLLKSNDAIISIFSALIIHKLVMGFSLGLNLVQSNLSVCTVVGSITFFSVTSPIGAAIGIVLAELYQTPLAQLVCGSLQAVACGTFLYVTFFEVLPHEMNSGGNRLIKVLCIILGFSFIAVMMLVLPHA